MAIELVPLCTIDFVLEFPIDIGVGSTGRLIVGEVASGRFEGRIKGEVVGHAAAAWVRMSPDGTFGTSDARATIKTHDGANIYMEYVCKNEMGDMGPTTATIAPVFESGDERYQWLNRIVAVGKGVHTEVINLHYDIYEVR